MAINLQIILFIKTLLLFFAFGFMPTEAGGTDWMVKAGKSYSAAPAIVNFPQAGLPRPIPRPNLDNLQIADGTGAKAPRLEYNDGCPCPDLWR
jgi:hypothetical protein